MANDRQQLSTRFEKLVMELFEAEGFEVSQPPKRAPFDFYLSSTIGGTAIVEVKLISSRVLPVSLSLEMVSRLEIARQVAGRDRGVLVIASQLLRVKPDAFFEEYPNIVVYDFAAISFLLAKYPRLAIEFEDLVRNAVLLPQSLFNGVIPAPTDTSPLSISPTAKSGKQVSPAPQRGNEICRSIRNVSAGRETARAFEVAVIEALKYLFYDHLAGWSIQHPSENRMSVYDLVARITPQHDFWEMLVRSFRSNYAIFEFKNYADPISQGQIYTTEKYLFATALRNVAIIVARSGADENALWAAKGALKEHGKLILVISLEELCKMLTLKDEGNEPSDYLLERLDDMLTRLER